MATDSKRFYRVLTEKGLRYILNHANHPQAVIIAKHELTRRGLPLVTPERTFSDLDGHERDYINSERSRLQPLGYPIDPE